MNLPEYTRLEMLRLIFTLRYSRHDWRSVPSLAKEMDLNEYEVMVLIMELRDRGMVRNPLKPRVHEHGWWRAVDRGYTWQECAYRMPIHKGVRELWRVWTGR